MDGRVTPQIDRAGAGGLSAVKADGSRPGTTDVPRTPGPIIFFDGVCGLCNRFIDFVMKRDRAAIFYFAPLQGDTARARLPAADVRDLNTIVLWEEQGTIRKSTAAARILMRLGGAWRLIGAALLLVPRPLRDLGYAVVARNRYAVFGKKQTCRMPTSDERARFLP